MLAKQKTKKLVAPRRWVTDASADDVAATVAEIVAANQEWVRRRAEENLAGTHGRIAKKLAEGDVSRGRKPQQLHVTDGGGALVVSYPYVPAEAIIATPGRRSALASAITPARGWIATVTANALDDGRTEVIGEVQRWVTRDGAMADADKWVAFCAALDERYGAAQPLA